tara:strand:+ start:134 stop:268 length:135 start_codon:yes stop_codon:yes gene_type:complete
MASKIAPLIVFEYQILMGFYVLLFGIAAFRFMLKDWLFGWNDAA